MVAARTWLIAVPAALAAACSDPPAPPLPEVDDPLPLIDPTIGTGGLGFGYGSAFVGAAVPHGLVKLGPDTSGPFGTVNFQHYSGYFAEDDVILGFSHLHLHGAGASDYGVLAVMPTRAFAADQTRAGAYQAHFAKADERARPGSYAVRLDDGAGGIDVELVATARAAHHRYDLGGDPGTLVIDLDHVLQGGVIDDAEVHLDAAGRTVRGRLHARGNMTDRYGGYDLWFTARTRSDWTEAAVWSNGGPATAASDATGTGVGAALGLPGGAPLELQLAVSLVSAAGADRNLDAELPAWDLAATRAAAEAAWRERTGVVAVTGGSEAQRRIFYTSLYHAFLMPTVIGDADGSYRLVGMSQPVTAAGFTAMSDFSLWDTYRTVHPLYAWLAPVSARDSTHSLVALAGATGGCPRWPIAIGESGTMLGASCDIVVADAAVKGIGDGADAAWPLLRAAALDPVAPATGRGGRDHVEEYMQYGYVPSTVGRSVSHTTEYAHDDFALANLAAILGHDADAATLRERSHWWRALYDPAVGFLRARATDGSFPAGAFDPLELSDDYAEANAWHSLWMAGAHDLDGLAGLLGGRPALIAKLETFFGEARRDLETGDPAGANFPRPYYWHGNEPDLAAAYLFAQAGRPDLTQQWSRWIVDHLYGDGPDGLAGNDDGGTLGAWYVFATLGLYPIPGSDRYVIGAPVFDQARITVAGHQLIIEAPGASRGRGYVAGVAIDGVPLDRPELRHADLLGAARITFTLDDQPTDWGR